MRMPEQDQLTTERMEKNKLISVIVPMYNAKLYIEHCLTSIMNNSYKNIEIICVDDGSSDMTAEIVKDLQREDKRIKLVIQKENKGVSAARNRGLELAKGEYLAFIDADDWVTEDYLLVLYQIAQEKRADLVLCGFYRVNKYNTILPSESEYYVCEVPERERYGSWKPSVWGAIYRRDICPLFNEELTHREDLFFNTQLLSQHKNIRIWKTSKHMYFYYFHNDSLSIKADVYRHYYLAKELLDKIDTFPIKKYVVILVVREVLAFRYYSSETNKEKQTELFEKILPLLIKSNDISMGDKIIHMLAIYFPFIYNWRRKSIG